MRVLIRTSGDLANCDQQGDTGWTIAGNVGEIEFVENNTFCFNHLEKNNLTTYPTR